MVVVSNTGGYRGGSRSTSLARVRRTTSASRRNSVSTGASSSARAAWIRVKCFGFGYQVLTKFEVNLDSILTSILPLLVTALRMTPRCPSRPGVDSILSTFSSVDFSAPSSLSLPDICSWFAAQVMLSLLERVLSVGVSRPRKAPPAVSILRIAGGGDLEPGLTRECPLPLLELFLLLPCRSRERWKFIKLLIADCPAQPLPGLGCGPPSKGVANLFTCGVTNIESSMSSASMRSSSLELLPDESVPSMLTLPKELDTRELVLILIFVDSRPPQKWEPLLLLGIFIARPVMVGEVSGDDCSARVE